MKRVLKRIGKAILLAILILAALIYAPFWDTAPPDVADLAVASSIRSARIWWMTAARMGASRDGDG